MTFVKVNNPNSKQYNGMMNNFFAAAASAPNKSFRELVPGFPPVNIAATATAYLLDLVAPGLEKTDFVIKVDGDLLTISATKKEAAPDETVKQIKQEFTHAAFKRSFTLNEQIDPATIEAKYENGILKLVLPKKEVAKIDAKEITIQ